MLRNKHRCYTPSDCIGDASARIRRCKMKRLLVAFMLATVIGPAFAQVATAATQGRPYKHKEACMYRGYPCSEWTRDDRW